VSSTFLVPLRSEALAVRWGLHRHAGVGIRVVRTGAGPSRAAAAASRLGLEPGEPGVLTVVVGVCGGLDPTLRPGDLVVADALTRPDGEPVAADLSLAPVMASALRDGVGNGSVRMGTVAGAETLVRGRGARRALFEQGAMAVDLESWVLASHVPGPVVVVRAVVDTADAELLSPTTIIGGIRALAALSRAVPVLAKQIDNPGFADRTDRGSQRL